MRQNGEWAALVSAALIGSDREERQLLQAVVSVARAIFTAGASSILLLEESEEQLVFEAVSGAGEDELVGRRIPADAGIAGWVLASGEPVAMQDVSVSPRFAAGLAASTGYVPSALLAAPLIHDGEPAGVLEVLDPIHDARRTLDDLQLLGLFAHQAVVALQIIRRNRTARRALDGEGDYAELVRIMSSLEAGTGTQVLSVVGTLLSARPLQ